MKKTVILIIFIAVIFSCEAGQESNVMNSGFVGRWNWTSTDGGIAFHIHETPESTGNTIRLYLTEDKEYSVIINDIDVYTGVYEISMERSIYSGELEEYITLNGNQPNCCNVVLNGIINHQENNTLSISDNCYDGVGSTYKRIN